jgi:phage anti-repressor protein
MQNLITINEQSLSGAAEKTVNARDLHEFLGVRRDFNTWIKQRIAKYDFVEGVDFINLDSPISGNQVGHGGDRRSIDYHLTLDMAKQLSMVENTERGRQARKYFIECERVARAPERLPLAEEIHKAYMHAICRKDENHGRLLGDAAVAIADNLGDMERLDSYGKAAAMRVILKAYDIRIDDLFEYSGDARKVDFKKLGFEDAYRADRMEDQLALIFAKCSRTVQ